MPKISGSICGAPSEKTLAGLPDRIIPRASGFPNLVRPDVERQNLGVNTALTNSPCDQLRVLRAEIENYDLRTTKLFVAAHLPGESVSASVSGAG